MFVQYNKEGEQMFCIEEARKEKGTAVKIDERFVVLMKNAILAVMPKMTVWEKRMLYRYAYIRIVAQKHRGDPNFEKEPFPPAQLLTSRVKVLLREAEDDDVRCVLKMMRVLVDARKNTKE